MRANRGTSRRLVGRKIRGRNGGARRETGYNQPRYRFLGLQREFDRDLVEAPSQAQPDGDDDRERIERTGLRRLLQGMRCSDSEGIAEGGYEARRFRLLELLLSLFEHDPREEPIMLASKRRGDAPVVCAKFRADHSRQCEQMPAISMTGLFGTKPAARQEALSASVMAPPVASPTVPHRSQIRNTTGSLPA